MKRQGAYVLHLDVKIPLTLTVGSLGTVFVPAGQYAYVGSARRGVAARIARHRCLAERKAGRVHWHIDYLLTSPNTRWAGETLLEDGIECEISKQFASRKGVTAPVRGFGSSDCRSGCEAHLYLLPEPFRESSLTPRLKGAKARRIRKRR